MKQVVTLFLPVGNAAAMRLRQLALPRSVRRLNARALRHYIHNIGAGTRKEDVLRSYKIIGHYRW
jgi:uncharacterized protein YijF (DUF1287 family)